MNLIKYHADCGTDTEDTRKELEREENLSWSFSDLLFKTEIINRMKKLECCCFVSRRDPRILAC